jgi:hypothetical protein
MAGQGTPSAQNIAAAYNTPQAKMQLQQPTTPVSPAPIEQDNNQQNPYGQIASMDDLAKAMGYTSPQEEERLRKASVANRRILAVADAMRHIGNIYNTVRYAPAQQFNQPVLEEQSRYERGKAMRDKANQVYLSYQQQKAAQDAKQKQWEQQFKHNIAKDERDYALKKAESDARANLNEAKMHRYETLMALDEAKREGIISDNEWRAQRAKLYPELTQSQIARNNRTGGGRSGGGRSGGSNMPDYEVLTENTLNDDGRIVSQKKTRTVKRGDQTSTSSRTSNFSIRGNSQQEKDKTNIGRFSIHK